MAADIEFEGADYLLELHGGEYRLIKSGGGAIHYIGRAKIGMISALAKALEFLKDSQQ
ncbi:MAG TPA: hypothetical protein VKT73_13055 [Xanthobacteraceae bacterium]|nr:hypothetical protein [Xanthobacteraceae bacterium]